MSKKFKGFTLIELIIVMAIFGVVMAAAIGLMSPVSKLFSSTVKYEQTRSAVDNIQRYLTGTVRYADRFSMYYGCNDSCGNNYNNFSDIDENVANFAGRYFYCGDKSTQLVNQDIDTPVYVLVFDNTNCKISKYTYTPNGSWLNSLNYNSMSASYSLNGISAEVQDSVVNEELLNDYLFKVYIGSYEYVINDVGEQALGPQDYNDNYVPTLSNLAFTIVSYKNDTDDPATATLSPLYQSTSFSFSLVNVIDSNSVNSLNSTPVSKTDNQLYYDATNKCFESVYGNGIARGNITPDGSHGVDASGNFYIIYTLPERAEDYVSNNQKNYNYEVTETTTVATT